jgi:AcrR family transcriptional regulator
MPARPARPARPSSDRILAAAERVFARQGYGETSLRQLMGAARISTTAFYARFDSKEAVLAAIVERLIGELQAGAAAALAGVKSPAEAVERGIDAMVATLSGRGPVVALALTEAASSEAVRVALAGAYRGLAGLIAGQLRGPTAEREAMAWAFVGALQIQVQRWAVFGELDERALGSTLRAVARTLLPAVTAGRSR